MLPNFSLTTFVKELSDLTKMLKNNMNLLNFVYGS